MSNEHDIGDDPADTDQCEAFTLTYSGHKVRLDVWLTDELPEMSRARIQSLIKGGLITINGESCKPNHALRDGEEVSVKIPAPEPIEVVPEDIPLDVLYEDDDILILNKPAGLVVHPAPGHASGTLVNALLFHCKDPATGATTLTGIGGELRPGIVHRLDKDTSGVLAVAKNEQSLAGLAKQFKDHTVKKEYLAIAWGRPTPASGTIKTLVGRDPHNRKKMSAKPSSGRQAVTHYTTIESFPEATLLRVQIETGRTHQIRVHLAHVGHPVVGDLQYGRARKMRRPLTAKRQMLHAERLSISHPRTGQELVFEAPVPEDMQVLLKELGS